MGLLAKREVWAWLLLAVAAVSVNNVRHGGPIVSDDSFQYLSIAENLAEGNGIRTSIVHFDQERSHGEIPAPVTWFPAGYPAAIALLLLVGLPPVWAGLAVSAASLCATVLATAWFCSWYRLSALATRLVLLFTIVNALAVLFGSAVLTESLYTALSVGAVAILAALSGKAATSGEGRRLGLWALCGLLIGFACWVRYAGLFLYASLGLFLAMDVVFRRRRELAGPIVAVVAATVPLAALLIRNSYLSGSWRGGNNKAVVHSLVSVVKKFVGAAYQLPFGTLSLDEFGVPEALVVLSAGVCGVLVLWMAFRHRGPIVQRLSERPTLLPVLSYLGVYFGAMVYLSFFSVVGISDRYCYPLWPLLLLLGGLLMTFVAEQMGRSTKDRILVASAVTLLGCYLFLNAREWIRPPRSSSIFGDRRIAGYLDAPMDSGQGLRTWIEKNLSGDTNIVVAGEGQATGYVLHRKTVSLVSREYSKQVWEAPQVLDLMNQFHADYLIVYADMSESLASEAQDESKFLTGLARGQKPPEWLDLAAQNSFARVFRLEAASSPQATHLLESHNPVMR